MCSYWGEAGTGVMWPLTHSAQNSSCLVFILLSRAGSRGQQSKQRCPDFPQRRHLLLLGASSSRPPHGGTCLEHAWNMPGGVQRPCLAGSSQVTELLILFLTERPAQTPRGGNSSQPLASTMVSFRSLPTGHSQDVRAPTATFWICWRFWQNGWGILIALNSNVQQRASVGAALQHRF